LPQAVELLGRLFEPFGQGVNQLLLGLQLLAQGVGVAGRRRIAQRASVLRSILRCAVGRIVGMGIGVPVLRILPGM
jgi:hypothetical protein